MSDSASPETLDYGPLTGLIGCWTGNSGEDISPEKIGSEQNIYHEQLQFKPIKEISNAEEQTLVGLEYTQSVTRITDQKLIHSECGYLLWDEQNKQIIKSLSIPRGLALVAGGHLMRNDSIIEFKVSAKAGDQNWGIVQSDFLQQKAKTESYEFFLSLTGDCLNYSQSMQLSIFDRSFNHTDTNQLIRQ